MSINWFFKLKEIDSLMKMRLTHMKSLQAEEDRLHKLNLRLEENHLQTAKLRQDHIILQQKMFELEKSLKLFQKQRQNLMDIGETGERYDALIDTAEMQGLELLDQIEQNDHERQEQVVFEKGLKKTIDDIKAEVEINRGQEEQSIKNLDLRLALLEEELPEDFRGVLKKVQAKNLSHGPFTRIETGSCFFCRHKISRLEESEIDHGQQLKQCPQCTRIFLPYGS